jgi:hypothetical protein
LGGFVGLGSEPFSQIVHKFVRSKVKIIQNGCQNLWTCRNNRQGKVNCCCQAACQVRDDDGGDECSEGEVWGIR